MDRGKGKEMSNTQQFKQRDQDPPKNHLLYSPQRQQRTIP